MTVKAGGLCCQTEGKIQKLSSLMCKDFMYLTLYEHQAQKGLFGFQLTGHLHLKASLRVTQHPQLSAWPRPPVSVWMTGKTHAVEKQI